MNIKKLLEDLLQEPIPGSYFGTGRIVTASGRAYFLKTGDRGKSYWCEANGLKELNKSGAIAVPEVIAVNDHFLITTYIPPFPAKVNFFRDLGKQLAAMHCYTGESFGFYENNFIGLNPQLNIPKREENNNWPEFYFNKRLLFQFKLAERNGYVTSRLNTGFIRLEKKLISILDGSEELPTLLHGDLWSGNYLCGEGGIPVLIDPAVYYGHREADLAMTKLFGGFSLQFYKAYMEVYPLKEGWEYRENIYKLYHVLNHLNLFGRGYLAEAEYLMNSY